MGTHRTTLSFHPKIWALATKLAEDYGYQSTGDFIAYLIRSEAERKGYTFGHIATPQLNEPTPPFGALSSKGSKVRK